jgi:hypothetical protein
VDKNIDALHRSEQKKCKHFSVLSVIHDVNFLNTISLHLKKPKHVSIGANWRDPDADKDQSAKTVIN